MLKIFFLAVAALAVTACSFNATMQSQGTHYLQGQWQQDSLAYADSLVEHKQHCFTFTCDSFYLVLNYASEANFAQDTCYKNGKWTEYVKGVYTLNGDTLLLKGAYVSPLFKLKKSVCYATGGFEEMFLYPQRKDSVLLLQSIITGKIKLKLKNSLICNARQ
jgi:hypothetical protein